MELIVVAVAAVLAALRTAPVAATTEVKGQVYDGWESRVSPVWPTPAPARPDRAVLVAPAAAEVWSGWVVTAKMTGFGIVPPLPGIWTSLHLDIAITLPVGVEAYAGCALRAWLSQDQVISGRTTTASQAGRSPFLPRVTRWMTCGSLRIGSASFDEIDTHELIVASAAAVPAAPVAGFKGTACRRRRFRG